MLGVVQTAEGLPLYHQVYEGNTAEVHTLKPTLETIVQRFPVKRMVVVADRGLLSLDNLAELQQIRLPDGQPLEFILAVPGRRYSEFGTLLEDMQHDIFADAAEEVIAETQWQDLRLVVAHDPVRAAEQRAARDQKIAALEEASEQLAFKLDQQDQGVKSRGRKLSDGGATAQFYKQVCEERLARIIKVDLKSELFSYDIDEAALHQARLMDGKLLLVTNVRDDDMAAADIVTRYKSLADIERGFKVLKSEIEIGPVYHRLPQRIKAHAMICFLALILHRVMRMRLKANDSPHSPERALALLSRIQHHQAQLNNRRVEGLSAMSAEQLDIFKALGVRKPTSTGDLNVL
jgi:transposase